MHQYKKEHLSDEEVKAVCEAIHQEIMHGQSQENGGILSADPQELREEYTEWMEELERRRGYDESPRTAQDY